MIHELKTIEPYFSEVYRGNKTFEVRKDDRGFQAGDTLILREYFPKSDIRSEGAWGKRQIEAYVTYVLNGGQFGIQPGYVVLAINVTKRVNV